MGLAESAHEDRQEEHFREPDSVWKSKVRRTHVPQIVLVLRGDRCCGKTSFMKTLLGHPFDSNYIPSTPGQIHRATMSWQCQGETIEVQMLEVSDREKKRSDGGLKISNQTDRGQAIPDEYDREQQLLLEKADCVVVMMNPAKEWTCAYARSQVVAKRPNSTPLLLVANFCDYEEKWSVSGAQIRVWSESANNVFLATTCLGNGFGVATIHTFLEYVAYSIKSRELKKQCINSERDLMGAIRELDLVLETSEYNRIQRHEAELAGEKKSKSSKKSSSRTKLSKRRDASSEKKSESSKQTDMFAAQIDAFAVPIDAANEHFYDDVETVPSAVISAKSIASKPKAAAPKQRADILRDDSGDESDHHDSHRKKPVIRQSEPQVARVRDVDDDDDFGPPQMYCEETAKTEVASVKKSVSSVSVVKAMPSIVAANVAKAVNPVKIVEKPTPSPPPMGPSTSQTQKPISVVEAVDTVKGDDLDDWDTSIPIAIQDEEEEEKRGKVEDIAEPSISISSSNTKKEEDASKSFADELDAWAESISKKSTFSASLPQLKASLGAAAPVKATPTAPLASDDLDDWEIPPEATVLQTKKLISSAVSTFSTDLDDWEVPKHLDTKENSSSKKTSQSKEKIRDPSSSSDESKPKSRHNHKHSSSSSSSESRHRHHRHHERKHKHDK